MSSVTPPAPCPPGEAPPACLRHGFLLHTKFQVVYPFPTFQPAFQLRKDHVVLLNTSFSLVACAIAVHPAGTPGPPWPPQSPLRKAWSPPGLPKPMRSSQSPPSSLGTSGHPPGTP